MRKKAIELKKGDTLILGAEKLKIIEIETSDISKQGTKKVRIVAEKSDKEKVVIIRPADYPVNCE